ncbi:MAG: OsmC family protein [Alphaproteobacteria bacterium]
MAREHRFAARAVWTGAAQGPTASYEAFSRDFEIAIDGKPAIVCSSPPVFHGDAARYNPEELMVASLAACHLLSYLALCARGGVAVVAYEDAAEGTVAMKDGKMRFTEVVLRPKVTIAAGADADKARALHGKAHDACFVANSVNFPVRVEASVEAC